MKKSVLSVLYTRGKSDESDSPIVRQKESFESRSIVRARRRKSDFSDSAYTREENPQFSQSINARGKSELSEALHHARGTVIRVAG